APRPLRKAIRKESAREGRGDPPGPQAGAQEDAARRPAARQAEAGSRRRPPAAAPFRLILSTGLEWMARASRPALLFCAMRDRRPIAGFAAAFFAALALAACSTSSNSNLAGAPESEDPHYATSPANIASLSEVVQK